MNPPAAPHKLAVLIDADNASAAAAAGLFAEIAKYGIASVKRIDGDWSRPAPQGWSKEILLRTCSESGREGRKCGSGWAARRKPQTGLVARRGFATPQTARVRTFRIHGRTLNRFSRHAVMPMQQFAYTKGKDATDMKLIIDAMDLLYSGAFDGFCLVSSDSDFTPLAARIRANGLVAYGFGNKNTPEAFRNACDRFIYLENLQNEAENGMAKPESGKAEKPDSSLSSSVAANNPPPAANIRKPIEGALRTLLYTAIKQNTDEATGWAHVGQIGQYLVQTQPDFDPRNYGYAKLSGMLKALGGLQFRHDGLYQMYCRKIPYGELIKLLNAAAPKLQDAQGWMDMEAAGQFIGSHWSYLDYGFKDWPDSFKTVHGLVIQGQRMRLAQAAGRASAPQGQ